jgi:hypothetical protein
MPCAGVEAQVGAAVELGEVAAEARLRVGVRGMDRPHLHESGGEQALDVAHRRDQPISLRRAERRQERLREIVAAAVELLALRDPGRRQLRPPHPGVRGARHHADQPVALERAQQPARVPGVEPEARAQRPHLAPVPPDLPQQPRLGHRAVPREEPIVQRPDPLGDRPVEAPHPLHHDVIHSLTLVRDRALGQAGSSARSSRPCITASDMPRRASHPGRRSDRSVAGARHAG